MPIFTSGIKASSAAIQEAVELAVEKAMAEKEGIATALKDMGLSKQQIAEATKLSIEEIEKL